MSRVARFGRNLRETDDKIRKRGALKPDEQLDPPEAYGTCLESVPPACSLETRIERFRRWLSGRNIRYDRQ